MDELDQLAEKFESFFASFRKCFARRDSSELGNEYVRALIAQTEDRRNAENMAEVVPASPRSLQRFLTESPWPHQQVIDCLQEQMADRLNHEEAVWVIDESGFPKQGKKSAGVARQYCGTLGKTGNCQVGVFLAYVTPKARLLVEKELYLPKAWTDDPARCEAAGIPKEAQTFATKAELGLRMLQRTQQNGVLYAHWVTADDAYGECPSFRKGVAEAGFLYVLEVPRTTPVWPVDVTWHKTTYSGMGRPAKPHPDVTQRQTAEQRASALLPSDWHEIEVAPGAQGPRRYEFACERIGESLEGEPGEEQWLVYRRNLDGTEPRYYFSNATIEIPLEVLARVASRRWPIETEFEETKQHVGLDEYEVRSWLAWHHHITLCFLANAFLLTLQQDWGEKGAPERLADHTSASLRNCPRAIAASALISRGTPRSVASYTTG